MSAGTELLPTVFFRSAAESASATLTSVNGTPRALSRLRAASQASQPGVEYSFTGDFLRASCKACGSAVLPEEVLPSMPSRLSTSLAEAGGAVSV
jgi:hypothetical protein